MEIQGLSILDVIIGQRYQEYEEREMKCRHQIGKLTQRKLTQIYSFKITVGCTVSVRRSFIFKKVE